MRKIFIIFLVLLTTFFSKVYAEKIPVTISPLQLISTNHDEIETGDYISFVVVNDVYLHDKLYIKKGTIIEGFVDFCHPNGWAADSAEININSFETNDINDKKVVINYPFELKGNNLKDSCIKQRCSCFFTSLIRGSEIYIEPDTYVFNIFIER